MAERKGAYQFAFEEVKEHTPGATHTIYPRALIKVQTKTGRGFALAEVVDMEFDVHRCPDSDGDSSERPRHLFEALGPFTVYYAKHSSRHGYEAKTLLYAFLKPPDGTVVEIPKGNRKKGV